VTALNLGKHNIEEQKHWRQPERERERERERLECLSNEMDGRGDAVNGWRADEGKAGYTFD
jgi:hypothetical protein